MSRAHLKIIGACLAATTLAACEDAGNFNLGDVFQPKAQSQSATSAGDAVETVERDIEAPDVFEATEPGLWDGRPSLGGVWVAHPDVVDPERVIIRNTANDKFVVGALFRREREIPGPRLQISSDAAEALGVLAGAPAPLSVVALRKEIVAVEPEPVETDQVAAPAEVETAELDPIAGAAAVLAEDGAEAASVATSAAPAPKPAPRVASGLTKPFLQIGIFSVESNAKRSADLLSGAGLLPTIKPGEKDGKPFWRVVVGPARDASERKILLDKIKDVGFTDAYAVTN